MPLKFYNDFYFFGSLCFNKNISEAAFDDILRNRCSYKFRKIHKKRSVPLAVLFFSECFNFFYFLQNTSRRLLLKLVEHLFLECFFSLDESILFHRRRLMSKFSEILILVCRKRFSTFFSKLSPIAVVSPSFSLYSIGIL